MAKIERILKGDFYSILHDIHDGVLGGSISASFEEESAYDLPNGGKAVLRVYERYSYFGGNRVSLSVLLVEAGKKIYMTAVASGGSQAIFFKVNTFGESAFLDKLAEIVDGYVAE